MCKDLVGEGVGCTFASALSKGGAYRPPVKFQATLFLDVWRAPAFLWCFCVLGKGSWIFGFIFFFFRRFAEKLQENSEKDLVVEVGVCIFALRFWKWGGIVL